MFKKKTENKKVTTKASERMPASMGHAHTPLLIRKPHLTEKTLRMSGENKYVFIVPVSVSKTEAAKQIEKLYGVACVKAQAMKGASKTKIWKGRMNKAGSFKKIIVTIQKGQKIEITGNT